MLGQMVLRLTKYIKEANLSVK